MEQVVFLITFAEDERYRFLQMFTTSQKIDLFAKFYTLMIRMFQVLLANTVELKKFHIVLKFRKSFYDSASVSAGS